MRRRRYLVSYIIIGALVSMWFMLFPLISAAQEISSGNTSRYLGNGRWEWRVFIKSSPQVLNEIRCVEYTLHPTFPNPTREVCSKGDPRYPFGLKTIGWGTFEIPIKITFRSGAMRFLKQNHMLTFVAPPVEDPLPITTDNLATEVRKGWWKWTVFVQGPDDVLDNIQCVEYTLHPTFPNPVREVCSRGTGPHAFALATSGWGTFQIRIRLFLRDGRVQELTHNLMF